MLHIYLALMPSASSLITKRPIKHTIHHFYTFIYIHKGYIEIDHLIPGGSSGGWSPG